MDQQETIDVVSTKSTFNNLYEVIQNNWKLAIIVIIALSLVAGVAIVALFILSKVYGKKFSDKKKKPPKCDHPKTDKPEVPEEKTMTQKEKIDKIDSLIDEVDKEDRHQRELEDKQRVAESEVSTNDVRCIEDNTSYEDES